MNQHNPPHALTDKELEDVLGAGGKREKGSIQISSKCHMNAPAVAIFEVESSSLALVCPVCNHLVTRIAIQKSEVH